MLYEYIKVFLEASKLSTFDDHMKAIDDANNIDDINRKVRNLISELVNFLLSDMLYFIIIF